ncbi:MAG TPA: hypothetical protein VLD85_12830 [Anaeromyxobacteraceae bacterium]|nr:hypothetical protein [Anaeromyxobacteraceae bacterium]
MTRSIFLLAAALLAACGGGKLTADEVRNALPQAQSAQINAPTSTAAAAQAKVAIPAGAQALSAVGQLSPYFVDTVTLAVVVNGSVAWSLGVLRAVVDTFPPTSCAADSCTWGPGSHPLDPRDWKLVVTRVDDHFDYQLSGQLKSQPNGFVTILSGSAYPSGMPHRGHGSFQVDHDAAQAIGYTDTGTLDVTYDNRADVSVGATALGFTGADTHTGNAVYQYAESATGGDLEVAVHDLTLDSRLALHSRWNLAGAGRGDAAFLSGTIDVSASECWSAAADGFKVVFYDDSLVVPAGVETDCAFLPAAPPTLTAAP